MNFQITRELRIFVKIKIYTEIHNFQMIPEINIEQYNYELPDSRIAKYPLPERDLSKLLVYRDGQIDEKGFTSMPDLLPEGHLMVFNDTKVVPARLHFQRETGAHIEIFCLEPVLPEEYVSMFAVTDRCRWKCIVGNVKRWKGDTLRLYNPEGAQDLAAMDLKADLIERNGETSIVEFTWADGAPFSAVLELCGSVPIPPYLNRETENVDLERYQTLYARFRGSVAAPTAGLHFTDNVLKRIRAKGIETGTVCLHVGAGTFKPVKSDTIAEHEMHTEYISVSRQLIEQLCHSSRRVVAVGTTSVRTLESLAALAWRIRQGQDPVSEVVGQWELYAIPADFSGEAVLDTLIDYLEREGLSRLKAATQIMITPLGYQFRIVKNIITNFHQPKSTLLLLVSAYVGEDWHRIYDYALAHDFRFLSYGDSSLLMR